MITALYLIIPVTVSVLVWSPALFTSNSFIVDQNTTVTLPDLHVLNGIPYMPPKDKDKPPSLLDLFTQDYPTDMKAANNLTMKGVALPLKQQVYLDFLGKSKFVGFYIPEKDPIEGHKITAFICKALPQEVQPMLDTLERNVYMNGGMGLDNARTIPDLTFTGMALIYYASPLTTLEKADIIEAFKAKGLDVQFRGPEYEQSRLTAWFNSHKNGGG